MTTTTYTLKRTGRSWSIYANGTLVEAFFTYDAAVDALAEYKAGTR